MNSQQLDALAARLKTVDSEVQQRIGQQKAVRNRIEQDKILIHVAGRNVTEHEQAAVVLNELEKTWRGNFEQALSDVAGQGLSAVFNKEMIVGLETTTKRNSAFTDITLTTEGLKTRVKGAKGGSVAQVFAAQLRQLMTVSHQPSARLLLVLDEPFAQVSREFQPRLCAMLREMSDKLGFQWLFSSHNEELEEAADVVIRVLPDGKASLETIRRLDGDRSRGDA